MGSFIVRSDHTARKRHLTSMQKSYNSNHPFKQGALVDKDDIRAIEQPASVELRTTLETTFWLQKALADIPLTHSSRRILRDRLRSEPTYPISPSSQSPLPVPEVRSKSYSFVNLPLEVRKNIYKYSVPEQDPVPPELQVGGQSRWAGRQVKASDRGLSVLEQVFPVPRHELRVMLAPFYRWNTFNFDLRTDKGFTLLQRWLEEQQEESTTAQKVRIKHWTWWYNESGE